MPNSSVLVATVQPRNNRGRARQGPHIVKLDLWCNVVRRWRVDDAMRRFATGTEPIDELLGIADGGGETNTLQLSPSQERNPCQDCKQVPAAVVAGKGVQFIDDHRAKVGEKSPMVEALRHQHDLKGFRSCQQKVWRLTTDLGTSAAYNIAVPDLDMPPDEHGIALQSPGETIQQRLQGADVEDAQASPGFCQHPRQYREDGGLGFSCGGWGDKQHVIAGQDGLDGLFL